MRRLLTLVLLTLVAGGCDDSPPAGPGALTVTLRSPNAAEGAMRVRLVGRGIVSATPVEGELHSRLRGDTLSVLVLRPDPGILRFVLQVDDTTRKPRASLVQVVSPDNEIRPALGGYEVEVRR